MKSVMGTGKTVEEAVQQGADQLGVSVDRVRYRIIEEPSKGFLGFIGGKPARVEVEEILDPTEQAIQFLNNVVPLMGGKNLQFQARNEEGQTIIELQGDGLGLVIGRHGQTLDSLQFLLNIAVNRMVKESVHFILDAENYRAKRKETLERLALQSADRVIRSGKPLRLEAMKAYERKIIHTALQDSDEVETMSEGTEPNRYVMIKKK
ncbi:RNA-binding cell elongation regulator Jag/EloR [Rubeoparvulum massiliense]|uniref:RNA-binding cell elongation regulator Jag/EloR n=1 Tax=Rubeoparvulum massiliense TaxID=1631346 RepID=UPI00065E66BB|nr:RNA-binding cell elongation regulator Jag/EloR [Rubeoparvulum massiliense]